MRASTGIMAIAKHTVLLLLRGYKWVLSPMLPPSCRYIPTCSEYAIEAVERYGALRGGWMAMARILRCHPFVKGGYDPVAGRAGLEKIQTGSAGKAKSDFIVIRQAHGLKGISSFKR